MKNMLILIISLILLAGCSKKQELNYTMTEKDGIKTFNNQNKMGLSNKFFGQPRTF